MELGTFGAVMGFASQLVAQLREFCETACSLAADAELKAALRSLSAEAAKDGVAMEQARRENVTEMILEPIAGLSQERYQVTLTKLASGADAGILEMALRLLERDQRFFQESSSKLPLPEVARTLRKVAQRRERGLLGLRALAGRGKTDTTFSCLQPSHQRLRSRIKRACWGTPMLSA